LGAACRQLGCTLVQLSTDYVFGAAEPGQRPHRETDPTSPQGVYARTKLAGEVLAAECPRHFVLRTCGLFGHRPQATQKNFVDTMLRLGKEKAELRIVSDQQCTPSHVADVARAILHLLETTAYGTYHVTNQGATTWYDFAGEIFRQTGNPIRLIPVTTAQYGAPAPRPAYSVLDTSKYQALGGPALPSWQDALSNYLAREYPAG
jgi:dTDP-4-dehydrorhamnose reductase